MSDRRISQDNKATSSSPRDSIGRYVIYGGVLFIILAFVMSIWFINDCTKNAAGSAVNTPAAQGASPPVNTATNPAYYSECKVKTDALKDITLIFFPVLATWVGTVIAFYFSKDNFNIAAQHTNDLVRALTGDEKLKTIYVSQIMKEMNDKSVRYLKLPESEYKNKNLKTDILGALLSDKNINRLPILDEHGVAKYIIHQSEIYKFLVASDNPQAATLDDLIKNGNTDRIFERFGVVKYNATLLDAKNIIDKDRFCSDVFVTRTGEKDSDALGWITNVIVEENSRL